MGSAGTYWDELSGLTGMRQQQKLSLGGLWVIVWNWEATASHPGSVVPPLPRCHPWCQSRCHPSVVTPWCHCLCQSPSGVVHDVTPSVTPWCCAWYHPQYHSQCNLPVSHIQCHLLMSFLVSQPLSPPVSPRCHPQYNAQWHPRCHPQCNSRCQPGVTPGVTTWCHPSIIPMSPWCHPPVVPLPLPPCAAPSGRQGSRRARGDSQGAWPIRGCGLIGAEQSRPGGRGLF